MNSTSSQAEVFLPTFETESINAVAKYEYYGYVLAQRNSFCLCVSARVDLLNSLPCFYVRFHQNDNSSNNKKDPRWRCRWREGGIKI